ncbi:MAG: AAA family ATPase, partial [Chloroflexi bacterium]|nr:AAA family ATPase [Chloroflexota bacterium]
MLQLDRGILHRQALWRALAAGRRWAWSQRPLLSRLIYCGLLAAIAATILHDTPLLLDVPSVAWVTAVGTLAFLLPSIGRWLLLAVVALWVAMTSLALAAIVALGALLVALFVRERQDHAAPVRFALLAATPWAATSPLALAPLAVATLVFAHMAWWEAFLQALVLSVYVVAVGTDIPWSGLAVSTPSLVALGGPAAVGEWWNRLEVVFDRALQPWAEAVLAQPLPYLKLMGLWAFAGLVGGRVVVASRRWPIQLAAACVAPVAVVLGLAVLRGARPETVPIVLAVATGLLTWCLVGILGLVGSPSSRSVSSASRPRKDGAGARIRAARWDDTAGYDDVKREVREALEPLTNGELRERLVRAGIEPTRGILLYGPPGTGKTLLGRSAASELGVGFVLVAGPEVLNKYVGDSEAGVRNAFEEARKCAPSILFFDEIEAIVPPRVGGDVQTMAGIYRTLVATFLGLMDGVRDMGEVVVMAATNAPDQIDPALLRPGRFDKVIYVPAPDPETRRLILQRHLQGKPGADRVDVEQLVKPTERFTGADLAGLIRRAYEATRGQPITTEQLVALARATKPTVTLA